ncbi:MAG: hypothetical protein LKK13_02080 [Bacilli bacterium]|jgi:hypothetical protein|nr:hypothetical protein [Bacilli bacterium]
MTFVMGLLGIAVCLLAIVKVIRNESLHTDEYRLNAIYIGLMGLVFVVISAIGGFRRFKNTSKIAAVYAVLAVLVAYMLTRVIWTDVALSGRVTSIMYNYSDYTTDVARSQAVIKLEQEARTITVCGSIGAIALISLFYFAAKKTLDGEFRWTYGLSFVIALVFVYIVAYNEVNFLNSTSNLDADFWALFFESRASVFSLIFIFTISVSNDYDPDKDPVFNKSLPSAQR